MSNISRQEIKTTHILFLFIVIAGLTACKKNIDCHKPAFHYKFSGFDSAEKRVIIIRRYEVGSNYTKLLSERFGSSTVTNLYQNDTLPEDKLYYGHSGDEVITLPFAHGRTFRVHRLSTGGESRSFGVMEAVEIECTQSWSIYVDDSLYNSNGTHPSGTHYMNGYVYDINLRK